jgi:hypothetical protein
MGHSGKSFDAGQIMGLAHDISGTTTFKIVHRLAESLLPWVSAGRSNCILETSVGAAPTTEKDAGQHSVGEMLMKYGIVIVMLGISVTTVTSVANAQTSRAITSRMRTQLEGVRLRPTEDSIQITFVLNGPVRYKSTRTEEPSRIIIDLLQTDVSPVLTKREWLSTHAALIRVLITRSTGTTHAVLDLAGAGSHTAYAVSNQLIVEIKTRTRPVPTPSIPPPLVGAPLSFPVLIVPGITPPMPDLRLDEPDTTVRIPWVPLGPTLDEFAPSSAKPMAARVSNFRQREPGDGIPVSEETAAYLSYDNEYLYTVFVCHDEPSDVRSHLVPREAIHDDDQVVLYLDTFHDGRHAYVFASNPFGVQQDGVITDGDDPNYTPDLVWRSEGRLTPDGFVVLIAIPFKSLRFSAESTQQWRIAVSRTIARRSESAFWPYITRRVNGFVRQMASVEGLELISPGRNLQLTPYGTFARAESFDPNTLARIPSESRRGGFDAKAVVKNAVTIDAAVNPDFSEVESDDPLVTVNQRFELFLPEKRPFFMENAGLFETPINIFFSRRIADPELGVRVTAQSNGWAVGGLLANDRAVEPGAPGGFFGTGAAVAMVRVQRQFGERSHIGVLATDRDDGLAWNHVVSADSRVQLSPAWSFAGQAVQSEDQDPGGLRQNGLAFSTTVSRNGPHFTYVGTYRDVGSGFRVPLGFVPRLDLRTTEQYASYLWRIGESGVWTVGPALSTAVNWDHVGQLQDRSTMGDFSMARSGYFDARVSRAEGYEWFATTPFQKHTTNVSFSSSALGWLSVWSLYSQGNAINYTPAAGVTPFLGLKQGMYASVTLRPSARLHIEQILLHEHFATLPDAVLLPKRTVFDTSIIRWKMNLQLTRSLAIRGIFDYNQLDSQSRLFSTPGSSQLMGDVLLRYVLHPGTALYVGFNSRYENLVIDPRSAAVSNIGPPTFPMGHQIFVKLSYLFRF